MTIEIIDTVNTIVLGFGIVLAILGLVFGIIIAKTKNVQYLKESFGYTVTGWMIAGTVYLVAGIAWSATLWIILF